MQAMAPFHLDRTEITVAQYRACVLAGACTPPDVVGLCNWAQPDREEHPVNCVDWSQATAYCAWRCNARLPTEIEWECAARGARGSEYPWGRDGPQTLGKGATRLCWAQLSGTCRVGRFSSTLLGEPLAGGMYDLAGNIWEWTASFIPCPYPLSAKDPTCGLSPEMSSRAQRGGSWINGKATSVRAANRGGGSPERRDAVVGFRCAL